MREVVRANLCDSNIAAWLTVHGRTKRQGYRPPAYWDRISHIREAISLPVIANGEIWTPEDARRCQHESGCQDLMLGRGAVADPWLVNALRDEGRATRWEDIPPVLSRFLADVIGTGTDAQVAGRVKQWLSYLRRQWPQAGVLLEQIKRESDPQAMAPFLAAPMSGQAASE